MSFSWTTLCERITYMNTGTLAKQMIGFQKSAFNHSFDILMAFKSQSEKIAGNWCEKNSVVPEQGKTFVNDWNQMMDQALREYKKTVNEGFASMENYLGVPMATQPMETPPPPPTIVSTDQVANQGESPQNQ
jgi:hypothetical protein